MNRKPLQWTAAALLPGLALLWSAAAPALVIDYADLADNVIGEKGFAEPGGFARTVDGVTVTAHGLKFKATGSGYADPDETYNAYLDSTWSGHGPGGLGVCKLLTAGDQCDPSSDDNLTNGEMLLLAFDTPVTITELLFRNADHGTTYASGADFEVAIDGGAFVSHALTHTFSTPLTGSEFRFIVGAFTENGGVFQAELGDELYIQAMTFSSAPEPGALALAGLGLLGVFAASGRRRRKA